MLTLKRSKLLRIGHPPRTDGSAQVYRPGAAIPQVHKGLFYDSKTDEEVNKWQVFAQQNH